MRLPTLLQDLWDTLIASGGIGLAAPQIGVSLRVVLVGSPLSERYPEQGLIPPRYLINPELTPLEGGESPFWEGCLSVPGLRGEVWRPDRIRCQALDEEGRRVDEALSGFIARVVQHECDHLDGVLYPQRLRDPQRFGFLEELSARGMIPAR